MKIKDLIKHCRSTWSMRSRRYRILFHSSVLPTGDFSIEELAEQAVAKLKADPRKITKWLTKEELALFISLEEI